MRILLIHNRYLQKGGEDTCFEREQGLLEAHGHQVQTLIFDNADLGALPGWKRLWYVFANPRAIGAVKKHLGAKRFDVVHVHNWAYYASPAILRKIHAAGVPLVVQVHNYRLMCVGAELQRNGHICHLCVGKQLPWAGIRYGCFQGSRFKSLLLQAVMSYHHLRGTFGCVTRFVVLSAFAKTLFAKALRMEPARFVVKGHSSLPAVSTQRKENFLLYVGRLSHIKGAKILQALAKTQQALVIAGTGPDLDEMQTLANTHPQLRVLGQQNAAQIKTWMQRCRALLIPSLWYEGLPNVLVEAFACGTPVLVSDNANLRQFVQHEHDGLHVAMGDENSWAAAAKRICEDDALHARLCQGACATFVAHYTPQKDYETLIGIYKEAIAAKRGK